MKGGKIKPFHTSLSLACWMLSQKGPQSKLYPWKGTFLNAKTQLSEPKTATKQYWETGSHGSPICEEVMETNVMSLL